MALPSQHEISSYTMKESKVRVQVTLLAPPKTSSSGVNNNNNLLPSLIDESAEMIGSSEEYKSESAEDVDKQVKSCDDYSQPIVDKKLE